MSEVMQKERERLLEYGKALQEMAGEVLPVFDGLVQMTMKTAKVLVGAQQAVSDIRRKARVDHFQALVEAGATPEDASSIVFREMELASEGSKWAEVLPQVVPIFAQAIPVVVELVAQWRAAMAQSTGFPETPEA